MKKIQIENYKIDTHKNINKRICLISDIHHDVCAKKKFYDKLLNKIKSNNPDFIILAGDIIDCGKVLENNEVRILIEYFIEELGKINKTLVTVGNHDIQYSFDVNEKNNYDLKWFKSLTKYKNVYYIYNESIIFNGLEFIHYTPTTKWFRDKNKDAFHNEFKRYPIKFEKNNNYKIFISHSPVAITMKHNYINIPGFIDNVNLILSGHMHNGALPEFLEFLDFKKEGIGIMSPNKKWFPKYCRGLHKVDKADIIISRGIKEFNHPKIFKIFNFLYNNEVTIIDLK